MFASDGKYSNIKNPKTCSCPVKIAIPVNNKIAPPTFVMVDMYFLKLLENIYLPLQKWVELFYC